MSTSLGQVNLNFKITWDSRLQVYYRSLLICLASIYKIEKWRWLYHFRRTFRFKFVFETVDNNIYEQQIFSEEIFFLISKMNKNLKTHLTGWVSEGSRGGSLGRCEFLFQDRNFRSLIFPDFWNGGISAPRISKYLLDQWAPPLRHVINRTTQS